MSRSRHPGIVAAAVVLYVAACGQSAVPDTAPLLPPNDDAGTPPVDDAGSLPPSGERADRVIDDGWRFTKGDVQDAEAAAFDDSKWESVHLPHTWNASDGQAGGGAYYRGIGVYRLRLAPDPGLVGKRVFLKFDGANLVSRVWVNGHLAGEHKGGYAAFAYDVTNLVDAAHDNVFAIKVDNAGKADIAPLSADYTFFGGLYRDAHLITTDALHVDLLDYASPGVYLTPTNVGAAAADLGIAAKIRNDGAAESHATVRASVIDGGGKVVATAESSATIPAASTVTATMKTSIASPHLWNGRDDPYLYQVKVDVLDGQGVRDSITQPLGLRSFAVDPNLGFSLNGRPLDLHGVNRHQDRLGMGWALTAREQDEDLAIITEVGCTAIRLAHYEHAPHIYDVTDRTGLVAWAEIPLVNSVATGQAFADNAKQQLVELIRQNYNHPSIVFWSIANEISLTPGPDYGPLLDVLARTVKSEDTTRIATLASTGNGTDYGHVEVAGFNRYEGWYYGVSGDFGAWADGMHTRAPQLRLGITEYGAGASVAFHAEAPVALDHTEEYQAIFHESHWAQMKTRRYLWGKFIWAMFDFASSTRNEGDTPGRNDKGLVTYDRKTKKDAFFFYKANWTTTPFVHITSRRFARRTPATIDIKVYGVADSVTVTLNGQSLGAKSGSGGVFLWTGAKLAAGANTVVATGSKAGQTFTDQVVWTH